VAILVDTNILSEHLGKRTDRLNAEVAKGSTLVTSAVNRFELLRGARTARARDRVLAFLRLFPTRDLTAAAADRAAALFRLFEGERGKGPSIGKIGDRDTLIAAIALEHGDKVLTDNVKHFRRVPGLELV
jgi:predicted nucleic acid-binding protein